MTVRLMWSYCEAAAVLLMNSVGVQLACLLCDTRILAVRVLQQLLESFCLQQLGVHKKLVDCAYTRKFRSGDRLELGRAGQKYTPIKTFVQMVFGKVLGMTSLYPHLLRNKPDTPPMTVTPFTYLLIYER